MASAATPWRRPTAVAARTFETLCSPGTAISSRGRMRPSGPVSARPPPTTPRRRHLAGHDPAVAHAHAARLGGAAGIGDAASPGRRLDSRSRPGRRRCAREHRPPAGARRGAASRPDTTPRRRGGRGGPRSRACRPPHRSPARASAAAARRARGRRDAGRVSVRHALDERAADVASEEHRARARQDGGGQRARRRLALGAGDADRLAPGRDAGRGPPR